MNQYQLEITDQRSAGKLHWVTLRSPELARNVRAGHYVLVRCAEPNSYDPLLRRPLFLAAAEETTGQVGLLFPPDDRGLAWLSQRRPGQHVDVLGPFGKPFELDRQARTLLLVGEGAGLAALLLLASHAARQGCTITLLAGASDKTALPPPFLLPNDVEYESTTGSVLQLLMPQQATSELSRSAAKKQKKQQIAPQPIQHDGHARIGWADQVYSALELSQARALAEIVRAAKLRWETGFASVLLDSPLVCGVGACGLCATELRRGTRLLCSKGPVVDLRDV